MPYLTINTILSMTGIITGLELALIAIVLARRGLFTWVVSGFWAWVSFAVFFVVTPLAAVYTNSTGQYESYLSWGGGTERGLWTLLMVVIGVGAYFMGYLRTSYTAVTWGLDGEEKQRFGVLSVLAIMPFVVAGIYSFIVYRAAFVVGQTATYDRGLLTGARLTGDVSGYSVTGYLFLLVPVIMLMLARPKPVKVLGVCVWLLLIVLSLVNAWSRFVTLSMLLVLAIVNARSRPRGWPPLYFMIAALFLAAIFQARGHVVWSLDSIANQIANLVPNILDRGLRMFTAGDTFMLGNWYLSGAVSDMYAGYDYGIPLINNILTGWIPNRLFPQKYFLVDRLIANRPLLYSSSVDKLLYGGKSSILGDLYGNGGWVAVLFGAFVLGSLSRKMDGMLDRQAPLFIQALGLVWMSFVWMEGGSALAWCLQTLGTVAMPALAIWITSRINFGFARRKKYQHRLRDYPLRSP